ncbi:uncharacterized protein [Spinacia oleracea]|uniref:Uncharacterized protein n=1 Tax=Spinacia oleracea TaxID=3562 RepID=A0A9R0IIP3_SPIOL|nr:uncharacterized protein LOC110789630 [Spinacia oleracea]
MGKANTILIKIVSKFVTLLGFAGAGFAIAAEVTRVKAKDVEPTALGKCIYPSSPAIKLAHIAILIILITQILISVLFCCSCRKRNSSNTKSSPIIGAIVLLILSWGCAIGGISLLVCAANRNSRQEFIPSTGQCYTVRSSLFKAGGFIGLVACILGQCSYGPDKRKSEPEEVPYQGGIAMANSRCDTVPIQSTHKQQVQYVP